VALLDFPASPTVGQVFTAQNGIPYRWDGATWVLAGTTGGTAGGDLTGTYPNPQIAAGAILDADINAAANIAGSKMLLRSIDALRLTKPVYIRAYRNSSNQAIPATTLTSVILENTAGAYPVSPGLSWAAGSPTRITCTEPGIYIAVGGFNATGTATQCHVLIQKNGLTYGNITLPSPGWMEVVALLELAANDYLELKLLTTAAMTVDCTSGRAADLVVCRLG
jgi:hypothetical protein